MLSPYVQCNSPNQVVHLDSGCNYAGDCLSRVSKSGGGVERKFMGRNRDFISFNLPLSHSHVYTKTKAGTQARTPITRRDC